MIQVMVPYNYTEYINGLTDLVNKKAVRIQRIDDAVKRILRVKFAMGLFENPLADYSFADKLGCKVGVDSARRLRPVFSLATRLKMILNGQNGLIKSAFFLQEHREVAREAVRKSLVLLKNGKSAKSPVVPLPKKASKILVAGTHADNLGYQCGGWTIKWQGQEGNNLTAGI